MRGMPQTSPESEYEKAREQMVAQQIARRGISNPRVLDAMRRVPRHRFVPVESQPHAYSDGPLPIGAAQTISQPYIVAEMTELLELRPTDSVLEVGVGSGYQTAILAELCSEVIGIERIPELATNAADLLRDLGYQNVTIHIADGTQGYAERAPYDAILVAAASPSLPEPLMAQLADQGRMIIPIGDQDEQVLELVIRKGESLHIYQLTPVRFVPLIGEYGNPQP